MTSGLCLYSFLLALGLLMGTAVPGFYMDAWGLGSNPHGCVGGTLCTESLPLGPPIKLLVFQDLELTEYFSCLLSAFLASVNYYFIFCTSICLYLDTS